MTTETQTPKQKLINTVNYLTDDQAIFVDTLIRQFSNRYVTKGDILKVCEVEKNGQIDTAIPLNYVRKIEEILPSFKTQFHVYDYRNKNFGEMLNVAELLFTTIQNKLNQ